MIKKIVLSLLKLLPESFSKDVKASLILFYRSRRGKLALQKILKWCKANRPDFKITLYDAGARSDLLPFYLKLHRLGVLEGVGFEPGENEYKSLKKHSNFKHVVPMALGGSSGTRLMYITKRPGCSSLFEPKTECLKDTRVFDYFEIVDKAQVDVRTLPELIKDYNLPFPEYIKMDIQGAEYEVLCSFSNSIHKVVGIHLEVHMKEIYKGEGLFCDIHKLLTQHGFALIRNVHHNNFEGEILEAEVAYVNQKLASTSKSATIKAVIFSLIHDNIRYAAKLIRTSELTADFKCKLLSLMDQPMEQARHTHAPDMETGW